MHPDSGTPVTWLSDLTGNIVNVHCECAAEIAAARFVQRRRHPGHGDSDKSASEILAGIEAVDRLGRLDIVRSVAVDTSTETAQSTNLDALICKVKNAFTSLSRYQDHRDTNLPGFG